ncbi:MAG: substrate-binding domain-containing protein [Protaetiibacter sp.]
MHRRNRLFRSLAISVAAVTVLALTSCSASDDEGNPSDEEPVSIVFIGDSSASDPVWSFRVQALQEEAEVAGADFTFQFASGDFAKQAQLMQQAVAGGADAIIAPLWDENLFVQPVVDAHAAGVAVYGLMGMAPKDGLPAEVQDAVGWDDIDLVEWGEKIGEVSLEHVPDGGTVMWPAEVPSATYITQAIEGFQNYFGENGKTVKIEVVETTNDATTATSRIAAYLTSHPDTAAVITSGAIAADSAAVAEQQMGLEPGAVPVIGQVVSPNAAAAIQSGIMAVGLNIDDVQATKDAVADVIAITRGEKAQHRQVSYLVITAGNIEETVPAALR